MQVEIMERELRECNNVRYCNYEFKFLFKYHSSHRKKLYDVR